MIAKIDNNNTINPDTQHPDTLDLIEKLKTSDVQFENIIHKIMENMTVEDENKHISNRNEKQNIDEYWNKKKIEFDKAVDGKLIYINSDQ